ncbi:MAG: radical SAM protein, partial [bacterium]
MNVLLLYPKYPDTFWSFKHVMSFAGSKAAYPPLGLLTVASMLPSEWNKKLIDMNINELKDEDILEADIVFISAMIAQNNSAIETIERCKSLNRTVVAGGPLFMSHQQKFDQVDHLILGEGELTLPAFLKDFKAGTAKHVYRAEEFPDMSKTPLPMWSLINFKDYATMSVQYSRGCPFDCEFCDIVVMNGRVPRSKTPSQMINELEFLYKAGWRGRVFIVDDNFIGNKSKVIELLDVLSGWQKKHKYPFTFTTQTSIDLADNPELMQKMRDSFFQQVFIGIETPHYDSLNECGKKQNTRTNLEDSIKTINNYGILVMGGFIVGFDSDPKEIFESQINFIQRTGVVIAMV